MAFFQIYTGDGKGKTTAAFGLALRALGRGKRVFIGQFLKYESSGEVLCLQSLNKVEHHLFGAPRSVGSPMRDEDREKALHGLGVALTAARSGRFDLIVLDELNVAVDRGLIPVDAALEIVAARSEKCELVATGRNAHPKLIAAADLVTEMLPRKHYYAAGVVAREGIEF